MRCLAVCQTELVIRMLDESLMPSFEVEFLVESKPVARRLHDAGLNVLSADPRRTDTYLKADITPATCVIVEDTGKRGLRKILEAIRDAGAALVYVLGLGAEEPRKREEELRTIFPEVNYLAISELFGAPLLIEFSRSLTRLKVQQYQRFFTDADRVLILLHNDPDPDAMASGLALRNVLRRTKQTAVIAALQGATRPENMRMANLLDIQVEIITPAQLPGFDRIAMVDVQPHYFGEAFHRVDLEAFSYLYPLADAAMIRKMEGAEITMDRLEYVLKAKQNGRMVEQVFCSFIGASPREDFIPYVADFYLQLEDVKWTIVSGIVNDALVMSVRNLGYSRNAGEFVRKYFADIGSAGGHRAMAKAVVPLRAFRDKFGNLQADQFTDKVLSLALEFLHEHQTPEKKLVKA
jgi:nanoRNase/pAp phosphatase (c-di-AMP/oligoRNAs hydrolase)